MQAAGTHRLDLGGVVLDREEDHILARFRFQMGQKIGPCRLVDCRILNRSIGEDQRIRVDLLGRIRREYPRLGHHQRRRTAHPESPRGQSCAWAPKPTNDKAIAAPVNRRSVLSSVISILPLMSFWGLPFSTFARSSLTRQNHLYICLDQRPGQILGRHAVTHNRCEISQLPHQSQTFSSKLLAVNKKM